MLSNILKNLSLREHRKIKIILSSVQEFEICQFSRSFADISVLYNTAFQRGAIQSKLKLKPIKNGTRASGDIYLGHYYDSSKMKLLDVKYCAFCYPANIAGWKLISRKVWWWYQREEQHPQKKQEKITLPVEVQPEEKTEDKQTKVPIIVRSFQRPELLSYSLNSLFSTDLSSAGEVIVVDDKSQSETAKRLLSTASKVRLQPIDLSQCSEEDQKTIQRLVGPIQRITSGVGLKHRVKVIELQKKSGDALGLARAIEIGFESNPEAQQIVIAQNDVLYNRAWLQKILQWKRKIKQALPETKIGCISTYIPHALGDLQLKEVQLIVGVCFLVTRDLHQDLKSKTDYFQRELKQAPAQRRDQIIVDGEEFMHWNVCGDFQLCRYAQQLGFSLFTTGNESYVQHLGLKSSLGNVQKYLRVSDCFVLPGAFNKDAVKSLPKTL